MGDASLTARVAEVAVAAVEWAGIGAIVLGALVATAVFAARLARRQAFDEVYESYRRNIGRGILLGLELLVAADIIHTVVVELTFRSLGVLGLIVVIRTFLSFTLQLEVQGRWPWQGPAAH